MLPCKRRNLSKTFVHFKRAAWGQITYSNTSIPLAENAGKLLYALKAYTTRNGDPAMARRAGEMFSFRKPCVSCTAPSHRRPGQRPMSMHLGNSCKESVLTQSQCAATEITESWSWARVAEIPTQLPANPGQRLPHLEDTANQSTTW